MRCHLALLILPMLLSSTRADEIDLAIENVTVIDVLANSGEEARRENQTVLVSGKTIERVAGAKELKVPAEVKVVDGTGMYLVPGFHDMHAPRGMARR